MDSPLSIVEAGINDIPVIQNIAFITWPATYSSIVAKDHLEYMLQLIYSEKALSKQITEQQHQFLLVIENDKAIAFADYAPLDDPHIYKLHKLYALPDQQGKGLGKLLINHIVEKIKSIGATALRLNVNRHNKAKQFYEHLGFKVIYEEDVDIGNGYFMNDYVMEMKL